jgi:peroxiredoxin
MTIRELLESVAKSGLPLQGKLDMLKDGFENHIAPAPVVETLHRAVAELISWGAANRALKAGQVAPAFNLRDTTRTMVSSKDLLARGPVILTFYRGVWCPYCNFDLAALEQARPELEARGASLVAISPQTTANSRKSQHQNELGFPVLSDQGGKVAEAFGVRWTAPEYLRDVHKAVGADLTVFNGDDSWALPMPARYVIARDGVIAYAEVNPDYTQRPEPSDLLKVLTALSADRRA